MTNVGLLFKYINIAKKVHMIAVKIGLVIVCLPNLDNVIISNLCY